MRQFGSEALISGQVGAILAKNGVVCPMPEPVCWPNFAILVVFPFCLRFVWFGLSFLLCLAFFSDSWGNSASDALFSVQSGASWCENRKSAPWLLQDGKDALLCLDAKHVGFEVGLLDHLFFGTPQDSREAQIDGAAKEGRLGSREIVCFGIRRSPVFR